MSDAQVVWESTGPIGRIVFDNRDKMNALTLDMFAELASALDAFAADRSIRVVVLRGAGTKAFVSGADISRFEEVRASAAQDKQFSGVAQRAFDAVYYFPKPTVAAIRGFCLGGGLALAAYCDLRLSTPEARFGIPAARLGLGYNTPGVQRLIDVVGAAAAREIFFTARRYSADEAKAMGLLHHIVPDAEFDGYVEDYVASIAANAPMTIRAAKRTILELLTDENRRNMAEAERLVAACFDSADFKEGRTAFAEKRRPEFKDE